MENIINTVLADYPWLKDIVDFLQEYSGGVLFILLTFLILGSVVKWGYRLKNKLSNKSNSPSLSIELNEDVSQDIKKFVDCLNKDNFKNIYPLLYVDLVDLGNSLFDYVESIKSDNKELRHYLNGRVEQDIFIVDGFDFLENSEYKKHLILDKKNNKKIMKKQDFITFIKNNFNKIYENINNISSRVNSLDERCQYLSNININNLIDEKNEELKEDIDLMIKEKIEDISGHKVTNIYGFNDYQLEKIMSSFNKNKMVGNSENSTNSTNSTNKKALDISERHISLAIGRANDVINKNDAATICEDDHEKVNDIVIEDSIKNSIFRIRHLTKGQISQDIRLLAVQYEGEIEDNHVGEAVITFVLPVGIVNKALHMNTTLGNFYDFDNLNPESGVVFVQKIIKPAVAIYINYNQIKLIEKGLVKFGYENK